MKLKLNISTLFFLFIIGVQAQDVLIKRNGDELQCKVIEVASEQILLTVKAKADSLPAETLAVKKMDVFMIRYANGTKDVFNETVEPEYIKPPPAAEIPESDKIEVRGRKFFYHHRQIGKTRIYGILRNENDKEIKTKISQSIVCSVFAPILKFVSIPAGVVGFIIIGVAANENQATMDTSERNAGVGLISGFILGQAGGYTVEYFQYKNLKEAVKLYNAKH